MNKIVNYVNGKKNHISEQRALNSGGECFAPLLHDIHAVAQVLLIEQYQVHSMSLLK